MHNIIEYLNNNPEESQRLLGIEHQQLTQLIEKAINLHNNKKALAESNQVRIIRGGGGRTPKVCRQPNTPYIFLGFSQRLYHFQKFMHL
jgi:hypothetical protein